MPEALVYVCAVQYMCVCVRVCVCVCVCVCVSESPLFSLALIAVAD